MVKIVYSKHFRERNALRNIEPDVGERVFLEADGHYHDMQTQMFVAVKRIEFKGKERDVCLVYTKSHDEVIFVTVHPLKDGQKKNRIDTGRWMPNES